MVLLNYDRAELTNGEADYSKGVKFIGGSLLSAFLPGLAQYVFQACKYIPESWSDLKFSQSKKTKLCEVLLTYHIKTKGI